MTNKTFISYPGVYINSPGASKDFIIAPGVYVNVVAVSTSLPPGGQIYDLPRDRPPDVRTWAWSYNLNLIGQDQIPPGVPGRTVTDLPPRAYPEPATRTWIWNYNLNLIGKDQLPSGKQFTDLPPRAYPEPATRTWVWNYNLNLIGKDALPIGKQISDLPPRAYPEPATRTWTWNYNVNLIGKDQLPVGEQVTELPRGYPEPATRTWLLNLSLTTLNTPVGKAIYDLPPRDYAQPAKTWTWNYNLNLIGKDRLPVGAIVTDLPPRDHSRILQTWIASLNLPLITVVQPLPFNQYTWPTPQPLTQPDRGFTAFYNPNLIGQDRFPPGARLSDLPPRDHVRLLQTWVQAVNLALTVPPSALPVGQQVYDLPPRAYPEPATRTWTFGYTSLPPLPAAAVGIPATEWQAISLPWDGQTWIQNPQTLRVPGLPPGKQVYDLSPRGYPEPATRTWTFSYSLELIGQDRLPFRQQDWPLPTIAAQPDRGFSATYNRNLIGKDAFPPGARVTDLPPTGYEYPANLRFFSQSPAVPPPTPVVTAAIHSPHFFSTMGFSIGSPANPPS